MRGHGSDSELSICQVIAWTSSRRCLISGPLSRANTPVKSKKQLAERRFRNETIFSVTQLVLLAGSHFRNANFHDSSHTKCNVALRWHFFSRPISECPWVANPLACGRVRIREKLCSEPYS